MTAGLAWYRLRATLRRRIGGYLALAITVGLVGGIAIAAMTAARRTDSSYPDYLAGANPSGLILQPNTNATGTPAQELRLFAVLLAELRHLPHVTGLTVANAFNAALTGPGGGLGSILLTQVQLVASGDGMFSSEDRLTITAGRRPERASQVAATTRAAAALHLHVGSRLRVGIWAGISPQARGLPRFLGSQVTVQLGPIISGARLRVVGTAALPALGDTLGIHPSLSTGAVLPQTLVPCPALDEAGAYSGPNAILVRMKPGVSAAAGLRSLRRITAFYNSFVHSPAIVSQAGSEALEITASALPVRRPAEIVNYRSMGTMPVILAGGVAAGAVLALGLAPGASVRHRRRDLALLKTPGFTRRQLAPPSPGRPPRWP